MNVRKIPQKIGHFYKKVKTLYYFVGKDEKFF